jgi:uncharacterized protein YrzB (UPF0473 family)
MDKDNINIPEEDEAEMMSLELDDGTTLECAILAYFDVQGNTYIALLPVEYPEGFDEGDVLLYRYIEMQNDEFDLETIDDEDEFELVADAFDEILDDIEFNEIPEND